MNSKKTIVTGASKKRHRYSNIATERLLEYDHEVVPIGLRPDRIHRLQIMPYGTPVENVHTITMYLGAKNQKEHYDYFLSLKPKRIIFNPGAENDELADLAEEHDIEVVEACTLVMLSTGQY